jgi:hypothetical protein
MFRHDCTVSTVPHIIEKMLDQRPVGRLSHDDFRRASQSDSFSDNKANTLGRSSRAKYF